jgi:hypothetical protein
VAEGLLAGLAVQDFLGLDLLAGQVFLTLKVVAVVVLGLLGKTRRAQTLVVPVGLVRLRL